MRSFHQAAICSGYRHAQRGRRVAEWLAFGGFVFVLTLNLPGAETRPRLQLELLTQSASAKVTAIDFPGTYLRLDAGDFASQWRPVDLKTNASGTVEFTEALDRTAKGRFFRAVAVSSGLSVQGPGRNTVRPGEVLDIYGQFFAAGVPEDNLVRVGGVAAKVLEASATRLRVEIPPGANSGALTMAGPEGAVTLFRHLVVLNEAEVRVRAPDGLTISNFTLVNAYDVRQGRLTLRRGVPLLNFAVPVSSGRGLLLAVSIDDTPLVFDERSTAAALVFLHPAFRTTDPDAAARILSRLAADPKIGILGSLYASDVVSGVDPFADPAVDSAYADALQSAAGSIGAVHRLNMDSRLALDTTGLRFLTLSQADDGWPVLGSTTGNPFDWAVVISRVDQDQAFPLGRDEIRDFTARTGRFPKGFLTKLPTVGDPHQFMVEANFWTDYYDLPAKLIEKLKEKLGFGPEEEKLRFLEPNALYVVRGISPAFAPADQRTFVNDNYPNQLFRAQALNAAHLMLDIAGVLVDLEAAPDDAETAGGIVSSVEKVLKKVEEAQPLETGAQWRRLAWDLAADFAQEHFEDKVVDAIGSWLPRILGFVGKQINLLGKLTHAENALERVVSGIAFATPLETALIETGDPFSLGVLKVKPEGGSVGDLVEITLAGRNFDRTREADKVLFCGGSVAAEGATLVVDPLPGNQQRIQCRVPGGALNLPVNVRTNPLLVVKAAGRRGEAQFTFTDRPTVLRLTPERGFAAVSNYLGAPFPGTLVRVEGFGFGPEALFLFGGIEATNKSGVQGNVTLLVPAGAKPGPIEVVRDVGTPRQTNGFSSTFAVLAAPTIIGSNPDSGPVGTTIQLTASNLGDGPATLLLNGMPLSEVKRSPAQIAGIVPFGATSGSIRLITPAGQATTDFTVIPGLAAGGIIEVGGPSVITLARAFEFVSGEKTPPWAPGCVRGPDCVDDEDIKRDALGNPLENLDGPGQALEEGDFMTDNGTLADPPRFPFSRLHADTIVVTNTVEGNFTLGTNSLLDTVLGAVDGLTVLKGQLVLRGRCCHLANLTVQGQLRVEGDDNEIDVRVVQSPNDGVVITGRGNVVTVDCVSNTYDGLVIDGGAYNRVTVSARANGGNGVTVKGGAFGNTVAFTTGLRSPITGRGVPDSGNGAHGIALLSDAHDNRVVGITVIAGNKADAAYLSGPTVVRNELAILDATANGGNGFTIRDGASHNDLHNILAESNRASGLLLIGGQANKIGQFRTGGNGGFGARLSAVLDTNTVVSIESRSNALAALRLDSGTWGLSCAGSSLGDATGLQLADSETAANSVQMQIRGAAGPGAFINSASGNRLALDVSGSGGIGVVIEGGAANNDLRDLRVNAGASHGVVLRGDGTRGNRLPNARVGIPAADEPTGNNGDGIRIEDGASANELGSAAGEGCTIQDNAGAAVRIVGPKTQGNVVVHCRITETLAGFSQTAGVTILDGAVNSVIADNDISDLAGPAIEIINTPAIVLGPQPGLPNANRVERNRVGIRLAGSATTGTRLFEHSLVNNATGVLLTDLAAGNLVGPGNDIRGGASAVWLDNASSNRVEFNKVVGHTGPGIHANNGSKFNRFLGNSIRGNAVGVQVDGAATIANTITANSITANAGRGIRLLNGGNRELPAPILTSFTSQRVFGTSAAPSQTVIELFRDPADEGATLLDQPHGGRSVVRGQFSVPITFPIAAIGNSFNLHATATDPEGNTSEFGDTGPGGGSTSSVVFTSTRDGNNELYLTDLSSTIDTRLTEHPARDDQPALSPGGTHVAFVSNRDGNPDIYLLTIGGTNPVVRLTTDPALDGDPAWSPDGSKLAFSSERAGNLDIFVMNSDGSDAQQLTSDSGRDHSPAWSPDGTTIAFVSSRSGSDDLWLMNGDGTNPRAIAAAPPTKGRLAWSPDGLRLAFVSDRDGNLELYSIRLDGSDLRPLTTNPAADRDPVWLPSGRALVFASDRTVGFELFLVPETGGEAERLTFSSGDNIQPSAR